MVVHLFLNNNKALDFLPINSIKNGGITLEPLKCLSVNDKTRACLWHTPYIQATLATFNQVFNAASSRVYAGLLP